MSDMNKKLYSPDIKVFSFDGPSGIFNIMSSLLVGPLRVIMRVMHNITLLPATLLEDYANTLMITGGALTLLGVLDLIVFGKWPLVVSQIPVLCLAWYLKSKSNRSIVAHRERREVVIDEEALKSICESVYDKIDAEIGESNS